MCAWCVWCLHVCVVCVGHSHDKRQAPHKRDKGMGVRRCVMCVGHSHDKRQDKGMGVACV